ncbi:hypothetical protein [Hymenobacter koreensis]|uniref:Uncharacterized protein n=1 Tax=Hymenobacter koreensis TaxID=1084523 RepID=A0ABP8JN84_9BACT
MACNVPLVAVSNDPCAKVAYGRQIVAILYQDSAGDAPTLTTESAAQAAMTAVGADKLFILNNVAASDVADPSDQLLSGNDVPYGASELTDRTRTVTGRLQYPAAATHTAVNALNSRGGTLRTWLLDDQGYLQGPIENASLVFGVFKRPGIGQAIPAHYPLTLTYNSIAEPAISAAALPHIKSLVNAA